MAKKSLVQQAREGIETGIISLCSNNYELAKQQFAEVVMDIEQSENFGSKHSAYRGAHNLYRFTAAFGQGFAEGLMERESVETPRDIGVLANRAKEFYEASGMRPPLSKTHINIGRGYGFLGFKEEGLKVLGRSRHVKVTSYLYICPEE